MLEKDINCNNLDEAKAIIKELQKVLEETKKQLETLQKRNKELEDLSITDDLTGLYNHRHFPNKLEEEVARNERQRHPLCLIFFDVDGLKDYNDTYGHSVGDDVLKAVAKSVFQNIRKNVDSGFRYGGDEFAVILPEVCAEKAVDIARRINRGLQKVSQYNISLSFGIAELTPEIDSKILFKRADEAMYMAKREKAKPIDKIHVY